MSEGKEIKEVKRTSRLDPFKDVVKSPKKKGLATGFVIILALAVIIVPISVIWLTTGNPFLKAGKESDYIGYAKIQLVEYNGTDGAYVNFTGKGAFIDYNDSTQVVDPDVDFDGVTVYLTTKITIGYLYLVNDATKTYINQSFLILANADRNNPAVNLISLKEKTVAGDLEANIYDLNGTRGEYHPSDLGIQQYFTLALNSTNYLKNLGENQFIPEPYRYDLRFAFTGLWLEVNANVSFFSIDNGNASWVYDNTLGVCYLLLPSLLFGAYKEYNIKLMFESAIPTYFKYYDGVPTVPTDLLLTDNT